MTSHILLAPVGAGKTSAAIEQILADGLSPLAPIWVLLPSSRQEDAFRQRLIDAAPNTVLFNVHLFTFYKLYQHLLDLAGMPQRELDHSARLRLLGSLINDLNEQNRLKTFKVVAHLPGFVEIVADLIYELKQAQVLPEAFSKFAETGTDKDQELAAIYATYQAFLQTKNLVDREGEGWLALAQLRDKPALGTNIALLVVDGFDQFNPLQADLLAALAGRATQTLITLPTVPGREGTIGRRFQQAWERLHTAFLKAGVPITEKTRHTPNAGEPITEKTPDNALYHLTSRIFLHEKKQCSTEGCLKLIEMPDPVNEVGALIRHAKRLLLNGAQPDDILIAVRDWGRYGGALSDAARRYGVPVALAHGDTLLKNPAISALINLLELSETDFPRRALLNALRSDYFTIPDMPPDIVNQIDRVSHRNIIPDGRALWLDELQRGELVKKENSRDDDESGECEYLDASAAHDALSAFFEQVTPPAEATTSGYIEWIENLIGADDQHNPDEADDGEDAPPPPVTLGMLSRLRDEKDGQDPALVNRDLSALRDFKRVLRGLYTAQRLLTTLTLRSQPPPTRDWRSFFGELKTALMAAETSRTFNRSGRVLVTSTSDARGLPHAHVLIPGLCESVFPAPAPENPLYLDSERQTMKQAGVQLETTAERTGEEGVFYELICQARQTLTLSRTTVQNGAEWPPSHLWRAVTSVFSDAKEQTRSLSSGEALPAAETVLPAETAIALSAALRESALSADLVPLYNGLIGTQPELWERVRLGQRFESQRMTSRESSVYSGKLTDNALKAAIGEYLGANYTWSASQLTEQGTCGFRFFAKRILGLEAWKDPEIGMDILQMGNIYHAILEHTYKAIQQKGWTISREHTDAAIELMREKAQAIFADAPKKYKFRSSALWKQEQQNMLNKLEAFITKDFASADLLPAPRVPLLLEAEIKNFTLDLPEIGGIRISGYIDRIDSNGKQAIVMDYKSGSSAPDEKEIKRGRNFQMIVYLYAGEAILGNQTPVNTGIFWTLNDSKSTTPILKDDPKLMDAALGHLSQQIAASREGNFSAEANGLDDGKCYKYCDFARMCRVSIMRRPAKDSQ